jgi:hypothetical protein
MESQDARPPLRHLPCRAGGSTACASLGSAVSSGLTRMVVPERSRIYTYSLVGGLNYTQASAACRTLSFPGFTGKGYLVSWNR